MNQQIAPLTQVHKMTWVFWITLPILTGSMLMSVVLGTNDSQSKGININGSDFLRADTLPALIISGAVLILLNRIKLTWGFTETGFYFTYFPFVIRKRLITFDEIKNVSIEKINPIRDFGGWGLRFSKTWGKAYTTSGNYVLRITLTNGKILNFTADPKTSLIPKNS